MATTAPQINGRARGPRVPIVTPVAELPQPQPGAATPNLDAAVLRVQASAGKLVRNAIGQIQHRTYGYVTLDAITDEVLPLLVSEELLWKTFPTALDGEPALRYRMTHIPSGQFDEDTMLLLCDRTSQGQGSGDTYARRYSLVAYLNLTVDEDDDGWGANTVREPVDRYAQAEALAGSSGGEQGSSDAGGAEASATRRPQAEPAKPTERRATAKQRAMLEARARAAKLQAGEFANVVLTCAGEPPRVWRTEEHAEQTLKRLLDHLPARLVTATKDGIGAAK